MARISEVTRDLFDRYIGIIDAADASSICAETPTGTDLYHLRWMCERMRDAPEDIPIDKASRWLGFVQGCLVMHGLISVSQERDLTRPLFHEAYAEEGYPLPDSISPET